MTPTTPTIATTLPTDCRDNCYGNGFASSTSFMVNSDAFMATHMSGKAPLKRVDEEQEMFCPALEGDSYVLNSEDGDWLTDWGKSKSFEITFLATFASEQDRDRLFHLMEKALAQFQGEISG